MAVVRRETLVAVLPASMADHFPDRVDLAVLAGEEFLTPTGSGALAAHLRHVPVVEAGLSGEIGVIRTRWP